MLIVVHHGLKILEKNWYLPGERQWANFNWKSAAALRRKSLDKMTNVLRHLMKMQKCSFVMYAKIKILEKQMWKNMFRSRRIIICLTSTISLIEVH